MKKFTDWILRLVACVFIGAVILALCQVLHTGTATVKVKEVYQQHGYTYLVAILADGSEETFFVENISKKQLLTDQPEVTISYFGYRFIGRQITEVESP